MDIATVWTALQTAVAQAPEQAATATSGISGEDLRVVAKYLGGAIAMGVGAIGAGLSEGFAAGKACEGIARNPEASGKITITMIVGQAVTESVAIYALVVAVLILFVVK